MLWLYLIRDFCKIYSVRADLCNLLLSNLLSNYFAIEPSPTYLSSYPLFMTCVVYLRLTYEIQTSCV